jgi:hypothetical protein
LRIKVMFRGPMLYVSRDRGAHVDEIVLPDASTNGCHVDDTLARQHFKGMLVVEKGNATHIDLSMAATVRIVAAGEAGHPSTLASYSDRVSLNQMANISADRAEWLRRKSSASGSTSVELIGGEMSASLKTGMALEIPRHGSTPMGNPRTVPILTTWTSKTDTDGYYQIDGGSQEPIRPGMKVYVYNWDGAKPSDADLEQPIDRITAPHDFEDLDMKWVYTLFDPPATKKSWADWLNGEHLPVPRTPGYLAPKCEEIEKMLQPPTSTCDGTSYCEGDPCL